MLRKRNLETLSHAALIGVLFVTGCNRGAEYITQVADEPSAEGEGEADDTIRWIGPRC